jgi:hypothetical protein
VAKRTCRAHGRLTRSSRKLGAAVAIVVLTQSSEKSGGTAQGSQHVKGKSNSIRVCAGNVKRSDKRVDNRWITYLSMLFRMNEPLKLSPPKQEGGTHASVLFQYCFKR